MPLKIPPELKRITPYIRRAEELDRDKANAESRVVAYYCRQFAVHTGIALASSDEGKNCLGEILGLLEGEKETMDSFTRDEARFLCQTFAEKIFNIADTQDREGKATRDTAKTFYAAASFLEILQQFYQDDDESEDFAEAKTKALYAKTKANDIYKAIKEGREPTPGGYLEQNDNSGDEEVDEKESGSDAPGEIPKVETASDDDDDEEKVLVRMPEPESEPESLPPSDSTTSNNLGGEQEGIDAPELGPPPPFPEQAIVPPPSAPSAPSVVRPPIKFNPPAPVPTPIQPPFVQPSYGGTASTRTNGKKISKAKIADAKELTQFALAALDDKNAQLAIERLTLALQVLQN